MNDFANLWLIIKNFLDIEFTLYGFHMTWGNILIYSLVGSLIVSALVALFKMHE